MANSAQAKKRARQNVVRRLRNVSKKSGMRTHVKKLRKAILDKNHSAARELEPSVFSKIDAMVSKGILHKNAAARYKSRLSQQIKALGQAA